MLSRLIELVERILGHGFELDLSSLAVSDILRFEEPLNMMSDIYVDYPEDLPIYEDQVKSIYQELKSKCS